MIRSPIRAVVPVLLFALVPASCQEKVQAVQRPEKVVSMREVVYDTETYKKLASLWKEYHDAYPSEDAYANWMYASRYAGAEEYSSLLEKGVSRYPANPTLLYLKAMLKHGAKYNREAQTSMERAVELDPSYMDPWFGLVIHYIEQGETEKTDVALRKLLESGVVSEEVMDFSYNMFACLDKNAVLVTNGDNDTYPGWILTRIVRYRPDVRIVNRSMLNTDWYPITVMNDGVPVFTTQQSLDSLRGAIAERLKRLRESGGSLPTGGPFSEVLIELLVEACRTAGRPVYFAATMYHTPVVKRYLESGRNLGLVTLVTPPAEPDRVQLRSVLTAWLTDFRTAGLDSWELRYAGEERAGRMLMANYGAALASLMDRIIQYAPERRLDLFRWYRDHVLHLLAERHREDMNRAWCKSDDIGEIREWCRKMNLLQ